jgi:hypothetical protein
MNLVVPEGQVRFVLRCVNTGGVNEIRVQEIGINPYSKITLPLGICFGFQSLGK